MDTFPSMPPTIPKRLEPVVRKYAAAIIEACARQAEDVCAGKPAMYDDTHGILHECADKIRELKKEIGR